MSLKVHILPIFSDNYVFIIQSGKDVALVDPGEYHIVNKKLEALSLKPQYILNTHHHWDHVNGNEELKERYGLEIFCSQWDMDRIPGADTALNEGQRLRLGETHCEIFYIPGHTLGHIAYYFPEESILFCGDTLFSLGCGRLFEGTYEQMYESLRKIKSLPDNTFIYCTHEYTLKNGEFALHVDPKNNRLKKYIEQVKEKRREQIPSIPSRLDVEKACNPFLRCDDQEIQMHLRITNCSEIDTFKWLRDLRNDF